VTAFRKRVIFAAMAPVIACAFVLGSFVFGPFRERRTYFCQTCFARKDVYQWNVGQWSKFSLPVSRHTYLITPSHFGGDFLAEHTQHNFVFAQGSPYYWGRHWSGCALGAGRHLSEAFQTYEREPDFRSYIGQALKDGKMKTNDVVRLMVEGAKLENPAWREANQLVSDYYDEKLK
jgi:hypothetical protein